MSFFIVTDIPSRRVVQYKRASADTASAIYLADDSVLGDSIDEMPFTDKTGITGKAGTTYEVPYLADAGAAYFSNQPESAALKKTVATKLSVEVKAGKPPYSYQWYKDGKQVVNVPSVDGELSVTEPGSYFVVATDADGAEVVSKAAVMTPYGEDVSQPDEE